MITLAWPWVLAAMPLPLLVRYLLPADRARRLLAAGEFPAGSMGPKIEAALGFLEHGGPFEPDGSPVRAR